MRFSNCTRLAAALLLHCSGAAICFGAGKAPVSMAAVARKRRKHVRSVLRLAAFHEKKGDLQKAIEILQGARRTTPTDRSVSGKLLSLYDKVGQPEKKVPIYEGYLKARPNDVNTCIALGTTYYGIGETAKARTNWEKALALAKIGGSSSAREASHRSLASAYKKFSLYHEAALVLERGCRASPKSYQLHYELAQTRERAKRYPEAIAAYEKALTLTTSNSYRTRVDWHLLALYKLTGTLDEALARRQKEAAKLRQELGAMYWQLAAQLAKSGRDKQAQQYRALAEATGVPRPQAELKASKAAK